MKTFFLFILSGALLGIAIVSWVVPPALSWYATPGGLPQGAQIQTLVQIEEVIRYSTGRLIRYQSIGAAVGAVAGLVAAIMLRRTPAAPAATATPSTSTPPPISPTP